MITAMPRVAIAVEDFDRAIETFRDAFGLPVVDFSDRTVPALGAHVAMCVPEGGSNIELMAPADPAAPLSRSLQRFLDRRGEGLYALMLEAPDPDAEAEELVARGMDVLPLMAGAGGRDIHPRSTHGVLIRVYPDGSVADQGPQQRTGPVVSGITRVLVATTDAARAAEVYGKGLGLDVDPVGYDAERGIDRAICYPPEGGVIELLAPVDEGRPFAGEIGRFLADRGEGMFALVLSSDDVAGATTVLDQRGVAAASSPSLQATETTVFGARILLERA
ncbi:MAG: VOC family protein [Acidimicrobiales bacterium]